MKVVVGKSTVSQRCRTWSKGGCGRPRRRGPALPICGWTATSALHRRRMPGQPSMGHAAAPAAAVEEKAADASSALGFDDPGNEASVGSCRRRPTARPRSARRTLLRHARFSGPPPGRPARAAFRLGADRGDHDVVAVVAVAASKGPPHVTRTRSLRPLLRPDRGRQQRLRHRPDRHDAIRAVEPSAAVSSTIAPLLACLSGRTRLRLPGRCRRGRR